MVDSCVSVYERLAEWLDERCVNRASVARKANISQSRFSMILNGKARLTADELERICNVVGADSSEFIKVNKKEEV